MSWAELRELQKTGFFDIQSHTYWHPNFKRRKSGWEVRNMSSS